MKKLLIFGVSIFLFGCSCLSFPSGKDYEGRPHACLDFARCMYYQQKAQDKTICADFAKECRAFDRYLFCAESTDNPTAFQSCWDKLNSK